MQGLNPCIFSNTCTQPLHPLPTIAMRVAYQMQVMQVLFLLLTRVGC